MHWCGFGRFLAVVVAAAVAVAAGATPAAAHGIGGREPTDLRTTVVGVDPPVAGIEVRTVDFGDRVELRSTDVEVVVLGYDGEPYLRIGPAGVFENARSPAVHLNRSLQPPADVPDRYDASAPPEWRRTSAGDTARWHDHRAHWMADDVTLRGVMPWRIDLEVAGEPVVVHGEFATEAAPPWWPWLLGAFGLATLVVVAARRAPRATFAIVLGALVAGELAHVAASWTDVASTLGGRLAANAISAAAIVLGTLALVRVVRHGAGESAPWVLLATVVLVVGGGSDVVVWFRSQVPSVLPAPATRALVALSLGAGIGLAIAAVGRLRPTPVT